MCNSRSLLSIPERHIQSESIPELVWLVELVAPVAITPGFPSIKAVYAATALTLMVCAARAAHGDTVVERGEECPLCDPRFEFRKGGSWKNSIWDGKYNT